MGVYNECQINEALSVMGNKAPIVRHYDGYIILAQNESDYKVKVSNIISGDTKGFYTIEDTFRLVP